MPRPRKSAPAVTYDELRATLRETQAELERVRRLVVELALRLVQQRGK